jgi:hypothetical protein
MRVSGLALAGEERWVATGQPIVEHGATARQAVAHYESLRACAELAQRPS